MVVVVAIVVGVIVFVDGIIGGNGVGAVAVVDA